MTLSGNFEYVLIPADAALPVKTLIGDKAGGLTDDFLVKYAKNYFHEKTGSKQRADQLGKAGPAEKRALAAQIRQQMASTPETAERLKEMDDETIIGNLYRSQVTPSCDITALTIPTPANCFRAVSLYAAENGESHGFPYNNRANQLVAAAGHSVGEGGSRVFGDVFLGRAHDDENGGGEWEREDFTVMDADPKAKWCQVARSKGGGGGSGTSGASSMSKIIAQQQQQTGGNNMQIIDGSSAGRGGTAAEASSLFGSNGAPPVREIWGSWTQDDDEVELKFSVAAGTKAKYCKVNFGRNTLKVAVAGQTLLQGNVFDPLHIDLCTFTLQDNNDGTEGRELCVTLGKSDSRTWPWVVR